MRCAVIARSVRSATCCGGCSANIGGDPGSYVGLPTVEEYDPTTDTWTRKADMLTAREFLSVSVLGGRIYVIGGGSNLYAAGLSSVDEYDPATVWKANHPAFDPFIADQLIMLRYLEDSWQT